MLPPSLASLTLSSEFNQPLQPGSLPSSLRGLEFEPRAQFDQPLAAGIAGILLDLNLSACPPPSISHSQPARCRQHYTLSTSTRTKAVGTTTCLLSCCRPGFRRSSCRAHSTRGFSPVSCLQAWSLSALVTTSTLLCLCCPSSLVKLELGHDFAQPLDGTLPDGLQELHVLSMAPLPEDYALTTDVFPASLRLLEVREGSPFHDAVAAIQSSLSPALEVKVTDYDGGDEGDLAAALAGLMPGLPIEALLSSLGGLAGGPMMFAQQQEDGSEAAAGDFSSGGFGLPAELAAMLAGAGLNAETAAQFMQANFGSMDEEDDVGAEDGGDDEHAGNDDGDEEDDPRDGAYIEELDDDDM